MKPSALTFSLLSIVAQFLGFIAGSVAMELIPHPLISVATPAIIALTITTLTSMPRSWRLLNASLPIALYIVLIAELPSWIFLAALLFFATLHLPALWTRVPYYPTPRDTYELVLAELPSDRSFTFIDIGCGMGDLLVFLSIHRPYGKFEGVEIALFPYLVSKVKSLMHKNIRVSFKSFWGIEFGRFNFIYAFLSPAPMEKLWLKVHREKAPEAIFFSNSFEAPVPYTRELGSEGRGTRILIYQ